MRILLSLLLAIAASLSPVRSYAESDFTLEEILELGLPVVIINTIDNEEPTAEYVTHPEGAMGEGITNATKVPGKVVVLSPDSVVIFDSGEYEKKESGMTVKIRGNTSAYTEKKPYKIKLQKKGDMLARGDKKFNDKNWVLIKSHRLKNWIGNRIGEFLEHPWVPAGMFVNVIFNDDYRGLYILQESIERNEKCRINVAEDGFVMEHDPYWWNEDGAYLESAQHPRYNFTFKYPDYEDADTEHLASIHDILKLYDASIEDGTYPDVIDVDSFANWVLGQDILGTGDGGGVNWYIIKNSLSDDSLLQCGPMWDFDSSEQKTDEFSRIHEGRFGKFFNNSNQAFTRAYVKRWDDIKEAVIQKTDSLIKDLKDPKWRAYDKSVSYDNKRWKSYEPSSLAVFNRVKKFYDDRFVWLENNINLLRGIETNVEEVTTAESFYKFDGDLLISSSDIDFISVTGIDGSTFFCGSLPSDEALRLPSGFWIVRTEGHSQKIIL
ncbi:MAG: hypothetical protein HDS82_01235 [Bacteroidales bacterium]|nr:hypothetical protein [Bacteroidales bacterium]